MKQIQKVTLTPVKCKVRALVLVMGGGFYNLCGIDVLI